MNPAQPDKVCMFVPSADGGMARYAWELLHAMADHPRGGFGYELVSDEELAPEFFTDRYACHPILPRLKHRKEFANKAAWVAGRLTHYSKREFGFVRWLAERPDIAAVHLQEWTPWVAASMLRRIRQQGKRVYFTVHNVRPHRYPAMLPRALYDRWVRSACRTCDGLFVHTERLRDQLIDYLNGRHPPIHIVPHGVWSLPVDAPPRPSVEERLNWKKLLFFGQIRRNKGLHVLLRAAEQLTDYSITIAGEPHEAEYYRTEILPQVDRLRAMGVKVDLRDKFLPESAVPALMAEHSAAVMPYTPAFVAQSGVIFLTLAHEIPVVASRAGGLRDLFEQFQPGVSFEDVTPAAVAAAVRRLEDPHVRRTVAAQIAAARRHYNWREAAGATIDGYLATGTRAVTANQQTEVRIEEETRNPDDAALATSSAR